MLDNTPSLSERLRAVPHIMGEARLCTEAADALDAQSALLAQAEAALEHFAWDTTGVVLLKEGPVEYSRKAREALAAIRATLVEKVDD